MWLIAFAMVRETHFSSFIFVTKPVINNTVHKLSNFILISEKSGGVFKQIIIKIKQIPLFYQMILAHQVPVWWATVNLFKNIYMRSYTSSHQKILDRMKILLKSMILWIFKGSVTSVVDLNLADSRHKPNSKKSFTK